MTVGIAFLTGQSDPGCCALSPQQLAFGKALQSRCPGTELVATNFPYAHQTPPHRTVPLWRASLANTRQYLAARRSDFALIHRPAVTQCFDHYSQVLILAGSCGLALLNALQLPEAYRHKLWVLAYGPVAKARGPWQGALVQGRRDRLSRWYFSEVDHLVNAGHMDYLVGDALLEIAVAALRQWQASLGSNNQ